MALRGCYSGPAGGPDRSGGGRRDDKARLILRSAQHRSSVSVHRPDGAARHHRRDSARSIAAIENDRVALADKLAFSEAEAARLLSLAPHQLRDERGRGKIVASQVVGRRIRYLRADLIAYLMGREPTTWRTDRAPISARSLGWVRRCPRRCRRAPRRQCDEQLIRRRGFG